MTRPRSRVLVVLVTLAFVASQANLARIVLPLQPSLVELQLTFSPQAFWRILGLWGDAGLARYRAHFPFDAVHPFVYGAMGWLMAVRTTLFDRWPVGLRRLLALALPVAAVCDLVENLLHLRLLALTPGTDTPLVPLAASASLVKWLLALAFAVALVSGLLRWLRDRRRPPART